MAEWEYTSYIQSQSVSFCNRRPYLFPQQGDISRKLNQQCLLHYIFHGLSFLPDGTPKLRPVTNCFLQNFFSGTAAEFKPSTSLFSKYVSAFESYLTPQDLQMLSKEQREGMKNALRTRKENFRAKRLLRKSLPSGGQHGACTSTEGENHSATLDPKRRHGDNKHGGHHVVVFCFLHPSLQMDFLHTNPRNQERIRKRLTPPH